MSRSQEFHESAGQPVQSFETVNPKGPNSIYTRLPDNRWARYKAATGEEYTMDRTVFVHPAYGSQPYPRAYEHVSTYNPLALAAHGHELVLPSGRIGFRILDPHKWGESTLHTVPYKHISSEPKEGWHPVEYSLRPETGAIKAYHLGHPVGKLTKGNYRA